MAAHGMIRMEKLLKKLATSNMKYKLLTLLCCLSVTLSASAQASGGQIRRTTKIQNNVANKTAPPSHNENKSKDRSKNQSKSSKAISHTKQRTSTFTTPTIQPIPMGNLATYNIVVSTFRFLDNAQGLCQKLRDEGWGAQIYVDSSNMYRVLMAGTSDESEAIKYRNHARQTYPNAWILFINNGKEEKYNK